MNYIKQSIWAFAAIALVACSSDDDKDTTESLTPVENTSTSFSATIETGNSGSSKATRTTLITDADVPYPVWSSGDQLHIYNATTPNDALFSLKSDEYVGQRQGVFDGTITKNAGDKFFALYCSTLTGNGAPTLSASGGSATISATIPSELQDYTAGFHPEYHFMTACTTDKNFFFKNAISLIKVNLADNNYTNFTIRKIHFKANNGENIAGAFTASIGDDGTIGTLTITSGGSSEITISNSDGSALATGVYYIPVLPNTLAGGFTLSFENTVDGAIYERSNTKNYTIGKSEIIDLKSFTAQACAKEAYVDLDIKNSDGQKVLWSVENIYDDGFTDEDSFYAWGETSVKANQTKSDTRNATYSWYRTSTSGEQNRAYKYGYGGASDPYKISGGALTKYNFNSTFGSTDNKRELDTSDDVAYVKSNGKWRIPSIADFQAMMAIATAIDADTHQEITPGKDLVCGPAEGADNTKYKIMNKTTNHYILLPMRGYKFKESQNGYEYSKTTGGYYWTRELGTAAPTAQSYVVTTNADTPGTLEAVQRVRGLFVRGVMYR